MLLKYFVCVLIVEKNCCKGCKRLNSYTEEDRASGKIIDPENSLGNIVSMS